MNKKLVLTYALVDKWKFEQMRICFLNISQFKGVGEGIFREKKS